jgi:glycosyltransferase involved in cell wall biosynthesis
MGRKEYPYTTVQDDPSRSPKTHWDPSTRDGCRISAVIPAFNEDRFIGSVVLKVRNYVHEVIVVDDGSQDTTAVIAGSAGATVLTHGGNLGKGAALNTGLAHARELESDAVVLMDADGQHDPAEIPAVAKWILGCDHCQDPCSWGNEFARAPAPDTPPPPMDMPLKADIVIGSRYLVDLSAVPRHRIWGHRVFNHITRLISGVRSTDSQSGFRAVSPKALQVLTFSSSGFSVESEMQFLAAEHDLVIAEAPITIAYQEKPKRSVIQHGLLVIDGILRLTGQYRPLLFFGLPGAIILLLGLAWGWYVVDIYRRLQQLAVGYAMISVLLTLIGMIALSTGVILHSIRGLLSSFFDKIKLK